MNGEKPSVIAVKTKSQVKEYKTVEFLDDLATSGKKTGDGFAIATQKGSTFEAKRLIFATGAKDTMSDIPRFRECWGISVIHCPCCHSYEFRSRKTGILANGERAFYVAS